MATSILIFVILSFLAITNGFLAPINIPEGISGYCHKSKIHSSWFVPTPIECCDHRGKCEKWIAPNATKYGVQNPDPEYPLRHCSCDKKLYACVTKGLSSTDIKRARNWGFGPEKCFHETLTIFGGKITEVRVIVDLLSLIPL